MPHARRPAQRGPREARDRGRGGRQARARTRCSCAPSRPGSATPTCTSWRACSRTPLPAVLGHESAGVVEAVGEQVTLREAGRPRHHLPVGVLRPLRACLTGHPSLCVGKDARRRAPGEAPRAHARTARRCTSSLDLGGVRRADAGPRARPGEDPRRHAARPGRADRLRRHHRRRRRVPHRQGASRAPTVAVIGCGGVGLSASRAPRIAGAGQVIAVDMLDVEARAGPPVRRHRHSSTPRTATPVGAGAGARPTAACTTASRPSASSRPPSRRSACSAPAAPPPSSA